MAVHIRKLQRSRAYRRQQGEFVCEGPKLLSEALAWGAEFTGVVLEEGHTAAVPDGVRTVSVSAALMKNLSDTETPQGVLFLCRMSSVSLPQSLPGGRFLVLDGVQDPGNVGTVWRTADAFGADGLFLLPGCADPFSPKTVRATMGACFRLSVWETDRAGLSAALGCARIPLYATALREDTEDIRKVDLSRSAVVIGSEGRGVSQETLSLCEKTLKIPMRERCESLNAAVAASVAAWEMARGDRAE